MLSSSSPGQSGRRWVIRESTTRAAASCKYKTPKQSHSCTRMGLASGMYRSIACSILHTALAHPPNPPRRLPLMAKLYVYSVLLIHAGSMPSGVVCCCRLPMASRRRVIFTIDLLGLSDHPVPSCSPIRLASPSIDTTSCTRPSWD